MKKLVENIFELNRYIKISIQLLVDGCLIYVSLLSAWFIRLEQTSFFFTTEIKTTLLILIPLTLFLFYRLSFYKNIVRFISISFIKTALIGAIISSIFIYLIAYILDQYLPRSVPLIYLLIFLILSCGARFQLSFLYHYYMNKKSKRIAIIYANDKSIKIANFLHQDNENNVIAFFDEKNSITNTKISGIPVFKLNKLESIVHDKKIDLILLGESHINDKINQILLNCMQKFNLDVKKIPEIDEFSNYEFSKNLEKISIDDILGRKTVKPNPDLLDKNVKNKVVFVTGAGGSIGRELCFNIIKRKPKILILFDLSEYNLFKIDHEIKKLNSNIKIISILGSIQNENILEFILSKLKVDTIYHAAAYKHVPLIEMNILEGIKNNVTGTFKLIRKSIKYNVKNFILVSSDKAVRPTNYMGATKRIAELLCLTENSNNNKTIFSIVRFGNVVGSSGSVVPLFRSQIKNGGPITVTHPKIERYFMTIQEAAELVIQAGSLTQKSGEIFILDMGKSIKILDLAKQMIKMNGSIPRIQHKNTSSNQSNEIGIQFSGLRPGEKMKEELTYKTKIKKTVHPRIFKTKDNFKTKISFRNYLSKLLIESEKNNVKETIKIIKLISDDFKNLNSKEDIITKFNE